MDNKLSELSKPVAWADERGNLCTVSSKIHGFESCFSHYYEKFSTPLYSQEYVSALQHESAVNWEAATSLVEENEELKRTLEAKDKQIAHQKICFDNESSSNTWAFNRIRELTDRAESAEKQLVYSRDATSSWERKAISNFEECAKLSQCIEELEKRLATPVRLKKVDSSNVPFAGDGFNAAVDYFAKAIRAAGFTVEGDSE